MTAAFAINGFGRIGRLVFRAWLESKRSDCEIIAINDLAPLETNAHLLKYDSVHGRLPFDVSTQGNDILIANGKKVKVYNQRNLEDIPTTDKGVDVVLECTGIFTEKKDAGKHLDHGARKVLISAPSGDADKLIVYGVNHETLTANDKIVSNASCTTNCLAPVAYVLHNAFGIEQGFMTTIHSYTGDQRIVDTAHKDLHRARAGALNMIPTSTGAAKAVGKVLPELNGKLDGVSIRVPTPNVSVVDFKFNASRDVTVEEIQEAVKAAAESGPLKGILGVYTAPLVSSDFIGDKHSSIFALNEVKVMDKRLVRILSWYDNEWGFSNRMLDTGTLMASL